MVRLTSFLFFTLCVWMASGEKYLEIVDFVDSLPENPKKLDLLTLDRKYSPEKENTEYKLRENEETRRTSVVVLGEREYEGIMRDTTMMESMENCKEELENRAEDKTALVVIGCFKVEVYDFKLVSYMIFYHGKDMKKRFRKVDIVGYHYHDMAYMADTKIFTRFHYKKIDDLILKFPKTNTPPAVYSPSEPKNEKSYFLVGMEKGDLKSTSRKFKLVNGAFSPGALRKPNIPENWNKIHFFVMDNSSENGDHEKLKAELKNLEKPDIHFVILGINGIGKHELHIVAELINYLIPTQLTAVWVTGIGRFATAYRYNYNHAYESEPNDDKLQEFLDEKYPTPIPYINVYDVDTGDKTNHPIKIHTVNGEYPPTDPQRYRYDEKHQSGKIYFLITSDEIFQKTIKNSTGLKTVNGNLKKLEKKGAALILLGCGNFESEDLHLVAEFIQGHCTGLRDPPSFVITSGFQMFDAFYQYRSTVAFSQSEYDLYSDVNAKV